MPDEAKFAKHREVGFRITEACAFCIHGHFSGDYFGECRKHLYGHGKHTGPPRGISVHLYGTCGDWEEDTHSTGSHGLRYSSFREFLPGGEPQELPPSKGKKQR